MVVVSILVFAIIGALFGALPFILTGVARRASERVPAGAHAGTLGRLAATWRNLSTEWQDAIVIFGAEVIGYVVGVLVVVAPRGIQNVGGLLVVAIIAIAVDYPVRLRLRAREGLKGLQPYEVFEYFEHGLFFPVLSLALRPLLGGVFA
jgi:hypothetical protein